MVEPRTAPGRPTGIAHPPHPSPEAVLSAPPTERRAQPHRAPVPRRPTPRRHVRAGVALVALVVILAACGDGGDDADFAMTSERETAGSAPDAAPGESAGDFDVAEDVDGPGADRPVTVADAAATGLERIRTAWITLEVENPEAAVDEVTAAAEAEEGFVALADLVRDDTTGELAGTLTVRVPSDRLQPTLAALEDLADAAPERRIEEEDVGGELTDLRAQITNLTAYEDELRALLTEVREGTSDPDDLLPVVERVQSVRSEIDRLRAQRDSLEDRVALSTITVTLRPTSASAPIAAADWAPVRTLQEAFAATGRAFATIADVAIWLVVTALPIALVIAAPPLLVWRWLRRRRAAQPAATQPPPPAATQPPPPATSG